MKSLEELTGSQDTTSWIAADVYAAWIMDAVVCYGDLAGKITAMEYDFSAGCGDTIQVRYINARSHSCGTESACDCVSATSSTFGTYSVPVYAWPDYDLLCNFTEWETCGPLRAKIMNEMAKRMAKCRDDKIWDEISDYTTMSPNTTYNTNYACKQTDGTSKATFAAGGSSCCTYAFDLYDSIVDARQHLLGDSYNPDTVILHPTVAAYFYYLQGMAPNEHMVTWTNDGHLKTLGGLKVIETCTANTCSKTNDAVMAVVIDSSRAVGEVWGMRPKYNEFYEVDCDRTKITLWQYWGASELDQNAIVHIANAS